MISRRRLLQALAIGAGTATFSPVLQSFRMRHVEAQASVPKRLAIFCTPHGYRNRQVDHVPDASLNAFKLGTMSSPLERHRSDLVVFNTLALAGDGSGHNKGYNGILTGKPVGTQPRVGGGISLDRHLAKLVGKVATPALPNLHLGMVPSSEGASFDENGTLVRPNPDPYDVYNTVFRDFGVDATLDPVTAAQAGNRVKIRKSVLDAVSGDLSAFRARLGPEDRIRADAQLDAIRTLEIRLESPISSEATAACSAPVLTTGIPLAGDSQGNFIPAKTRANFDLMLSAFACDLTRIATFFLETQADRGIIANFPGVQAGDSWHAISHEAAGAGYEAFVRANNWAFEQVAAFADRLKAIPEGDGTMLDNTVILVVSEISLTHSTSDYVWYSIGGRNLGVKGGRMLNFQGEPHWKLLTSLMNMMGVPGAFGDAPGPLEGYPG